LLSPGEDVHETRVSFADDKLLLLVSTRKSDGKEFDASWTREWNAVTSYTGAMMRPSSGMLRFPSRVGDKYAFKFESLPWRVRTVTANVTGTATVVGWETVEVPAGKFRTMRWDMEYVSRNVDGSGSFSQQGSQGSAWYAPEVRRWVKYQFVTPGRSFSEELLRYKLTED
jgi:hypothetical protein